MMASRKQRSFLLHEEELAAVLGLILHVHPAEEIAGDDVEGGSFRVGVACGMVADAADEAAALHYDIDMSGH